MSIFSSLIPEAHPNHNVFDLSHRDVFSLKSGPVTPCFVLHTIPNATYEINPTNQVEVSTMAKANFARLKQNIEYYFVPYSQLWRWFEPFYYQRVDAVRSPSNIVNPSVPSFVPNFNLYQLLRYLSYCYFATNFVEVISSRLFELNFDNDELQDGSKYTMEQLRSYVLHDFEDFLYSDYLELSESGTQESFDLSDFRDIHGHFAVEEVLRNLDLLGYGNWLPVFQQFLTESYYLEKITLVDSGDYGYGNKTFASFTSFADALIEYVSGSSDLIQALYEFSLGVTQQSWFDNIPSVPFWFAQNKYFSCFPILAFLKVWSDNFRNTQYDNTNYSYFYNLDFLTETSNSVDLYKILGCLIPRYRLYRRDIVTGTYPNAQFGDVAVASLQNPSKITAETFSADNNINVAVNRQGVLQNQVSSGVYNSNYSISSGISALAIRQAEALQRYREKNLRAGSRLTNQQSAFFGDKSKYLGEDYSQFLHSNDSAILINTIVASAESSEISLGDKGSYAASASNSKSFTFHSHDFGLIIGVMYIMPVAEYENYGFDPQVKKIENGDFFHPDLQNLGLSPVYNDIIAAFDPESVSAPNESVLGFSAHDWEYKTALDRVHGQFNQFKGIFGDYVTPRNSSDFAVNKLSNLYVDSSDIDSIFLQQSDYTQSSDQFKCNFYHEIKAVLPMSVTGLPY